MYSASDLRKGLKIEMDGDPYEVVDFQFVKPGKGQALYRCRIKNLLTGSTQDKTYRSADKIDTPNLMERELTFSYVNQERYVFMDQESFEEVMVDADLLGDRRYFLTDNMEIKALFHNDRPIEITLPFFVEMTLAETEPGVRGDTATNVQKPARLTNGYELPVPLFVNAGDVVRIDTRTGKYVGRTGTA